MIIATVNVNGIRAATTKGMLEWLETTPLDVVLMQEVRATTEQAEKALAPALAAGWQLAVAPAAAKGRAGVGILTKKPLADVQIGLPEFEDAGRFIQGTIDGVRVASLYLPSGDAGTPKQEEKYQFLDVFETELAQLAKGHSEMVIGGDWNICHRKEDLKNWKTNQKKAGFLPEERQFMDRVFGAFPEEASQQGTPVNEDPEWFDVYRRLHPAGNAYTWWTYRGQAFDNDAGWRIDYQAATKAMLDRAQTVRVDRAPSYDTRWSDHSPLVVEYR